MPERVVRDVMQSVPLLEANEPAERALAESGDADVVVVRRALGTLPAIVRVDRVRAADKGATLATLILAEEDPPPLLDADIPIDAAVKRLAKSFVLDPSLGGALVELEADRWAVVPRAVFIERAALVTTRGGDRLEGAPIDVLEFVCEVDHERKVVGYYDPAAPPRCSNGHTMTLVE